MGKVLAIDERFRFRPEHVRIKLACRDVSRVPAVAEGTLGLKIYDFFFEREVVDNPSLVPLRLVILLTRQATKNPGWRKPQKAMILLIWALAQVQCLGKDMLVPTLLLVRCML